MTIANGNISILGRIVAAKRKRIAKDKLSVSFSAMVRRVDGVNRDSAALRFADVLSGGRVGSGGGVENDGYRVSVIAEMKRSSPSAGVMDISLDPELRAEEYCRGGASAISVLTERDYFMGSMSDLESVGSLAHGYGVGVLEKDFVVDEYQIYQARASGADSVLLIVGLLDPLHYADLYAVSVGVGMEPLVEVFDEAELDVALTAAEPRIVGVNNRDLRSLETSLDVFPRLSRRIPDSVVKVAESGMRSVDDVKRMADSGANAVLVGESLMKAQGDVSELVSAMSGLSV